MRTAFLRTPLRWTELRRSFLRIAWWTLARVARLYRATLVRDVRVVTIVGSYGKTTTTRAVAAVLGCDASRREPGHKLLRVRRGDRHAAIEVGINGPGQMARHARVLRPQVVVVTSVGSEHRRLQQAGLTRTEKADMVRALGPSDLAILNGDDPNVRWMATQTAAQIRTFGLGPGHDVWAGDVSLCWPHGTRFVVHAGTESCPVLVRLLGRHMVYPVLAALTVGLAEGVSLDIAVAALQELAPAPGRLEPVTLPNGAVVVYDHYKSPVETVDAALDVMSEIPARRKLLVLGDVDEPPRQTRDDVYEMYARLGARIAAIADRAIVVNLDIGQPRPDYIEGALAAGMAREAIVAVETVQQAAEALTTDLQPGDVVLVKGARQQRFDRIALALAGRDVGCALAFCLAWVGCASCPMLERGWEGSTRPAGPSMAQVTRRRQSIR